jgi:hypothetical protein
MQTKESMKKLIKTLEKDLNHKKKQLLQLTVKRKKP